MKSHQMNYIWGKLYTGDNDPFIIPQQTILPHLVFDLGYIDADIDKRIAWLNSNFAKKFRIA